MNCTTCGQEVETPTTFCQHCGAPVGGGASVAVPQAGPSIRFTLEASALGLFGRSLLLGLSAIFIVPLPWTTSWFASWFAGEVRAGDGRTFDFHGNAKNVWAIVTAYVLMIIISAILGAVGEEDPTLAWLVLPDIAINLAMLFVGWFFLRWAIDHLELGEKRWHFVGSVWGFLGWNILFYLSILTIIGWAWAAVGLYNWIADNVEDAGGKLRFLGTGHEMLWRTIVMVLWCATLLGLPWAIRWFYAWLISQFELTPTEQV